MKSHRSFKLNRRNVLFIKQYVLINMKFGCKMSFKDIQYRLK